MTNGGEVGTSGSERRALLLSLLAFGGVGIAFAIVNSTSVVADRARLGRPVAAWEPWTWELSSVAAFLAIAPAIMWASQRLRPPRASWPAAIGIHLLLTVPASLAHVALMSGLREAVYFVAGDDYRAGGGLLDVVLYEYRKDLITYAAIAFLPHVMSRLLNRPRPTGSEQHIEIRDGSRRFRVAPHEIDWAQAAGNYVELHGHFGSVLHRRTLATLAEELNGHGFARIHRSRIVRLSAVRAIETNASGDFSIKLASGETISGSRRYRSNLDAAP